MPTSLLQQAALRPLQTITIYNDKGATIDPTTQRQTRQETTAATCQGDIQPASIIRSGSLTLTSDAVRADATDVAFIDGVGQLSILKVGVIIADPLGNRYEVIHASPMITTTLLLLKQISGLVA